MNAADLHAAWRQQPVAGLEAIIGPGWPLVLAPHPDDESLGCGGLIAACVAAGRPPLVAILTDGSGSHPGSAAFPPDRLRQVRACEAAAAVAALGLPAGRLHFLNVRDTAAPHDGPGLDAVVRRLSALVRQSPGCSSILAPWRMDPHCDHEAASLAAEHVAAACGLAHLAYPVWGWMLPPDRPLAVGAPTGHRLDIEPFLPAKRQAIAAHRSQYGGLITDDPNGFVLPDGLLAVFESRYETFLTP
jgi:LmbE family N-acetylglucosaminyl deacetylase